MTDFSDQEKTESPTERRREQARDKGEVARSPEVTTALVLLSSAALLNTAAGPLGETLRGLFAHALEIAVAPPAGVDAASAWLASLGWRLLAAVAPIVLGLALISAAAGAIQARGIFSTKVLAPDLSRISPAQGLKRLLSPRSLVELLKSLLKLMIVSGAVYVSLRRAWPDMIALQQQSPYTLLLVMRRYAVRVLATAGVAYLALAAADYLWQLWTHEQKLRMSRQELKEEQKESDGDAQMKARLRSMGRSLLRRRMFNDVATADVVVTNPTHIAVALKYDTSVAPAPLVVALGQRKVAERIKALARAAGVPVIENKPLARALLATSRVGLPIPTELYLAVAEVLAFVMRRRRYAGAWRGEVV